METRSISIDVAETNKKVAKFFRQWEDKIKNINPAPKKF